MSKYKLEVEFEADSLAEAILKAGEATPRSFSPEDSEAAQRAGLIHYRLREMGSAKEVTLSVRQPGRGWASGGYVSGGAGGILPGYPSAELINRIVHDG